MAEEVVFVDVLDEELDAAIEKADLALGKLDDVKDAQRDVEDDIPDITDYGDELKGLDRASRRVMSRIPGLREASRLTTQLESLMKLGPAGYATLFFLIFEMLTYLKREQERREKEEKDFERMVREYRGFTHEEFLKWREEDRQRMDAYRSQPPS